MNKEEFKKLNDEFLKLIADDDLGAYDKTLLDLIVPAYLKMNPGTTIENYLDSYRRSYPQYDMEACSEKLIGEIRKYIAHYWD